MAGMPVVIDDHLSIEESDIHIVFIRSSGPGGQNVNKTASKAQLRFNINTPAISEEVKDRLYKIAGKRINEKGELVIERSASGPGAKPPGCCRTAGQLLRLAHMSRARQTRPTLRP
jgi:ribosome-associated protein